MTETMVDQRDIEAEKLEGFVVDEIEGLRAYFKAKRLSPRLALLIANSFIGHALLAQYGGKADVALEALKKLNLALREDIRATAAIWPIQQGAHDVRQK